MTAFSRHHIKVNPTTAAALDLVDHQRGHSTATATSTYGQDGNVAVAELEHGFYLLSEAVYGMLCDGYALICF